MSRADTTCMILIGIFLAGCVQPPAPGPAAEPVAPTDLQDSGPAGAAPAAQTQPVPAPATQTQPAPAPAPVTFSGRILAPSPAYLHMGHGCSGWEQEYRPVRESIDVTFPFQESYDNWSFVFDSPGFEASFNQKFSAGYYYAEHFGRVPPTSISVTVCSRHQVDAEFELTLIPPTSKVFAGNAAAPRSCDDSSTFLLDGDYDGWAYAFSVDGVYAKFYGKHWLGGGTRGSVPEGAWAVVVCNETRIDPEFRLILTPPPTGETAPGAQHHRGAWSAGLLRPNAPCTSQGLPTPSDPVADGTLYDAFRVNPSSRGQPYKLVVIENAAGRAPVVLPGVFVSFYGSEGQEIHASPAVPRDGETPTRPVVPDAAMYAVLWSCETGPVVANYVAGPFVG